MPPSLVGAGAVSRVTNSSTTPALPTGLQVDDLLILFDAAVDWNGNPATPDTPAGWTQKISYRNTGSNGLARITWIYRAYAAGVTAPTVTYSGTSGASHASQVIAIRGAAISGDPTDTITPGSSTPQSAAQVGGITGMTTTVAGSLLLVAAVRDDQMTSSTVLTGDGLTWAKLVADYSNGTASGLSMLCHYAVTSAATTIASKTVTISGTDAAGAALMWALRPGVSSYPRTAAEGATTGDAAGRVRSGARTSAQATSATDGVGRTRASARAVADSVGTGNATTRGRAGGRPVPEATTTTDAATRTGAGGRAVAEACSVTDAAGWARLMPPGRRGRWGNHGHRRAYEGGRQPGRRPGPHRRRRRGHAGDRTRRRRRNAGHRCRGWRTGAGARRSGYRGSW